MSYTLDVNERVLQGQELKLDSIDSRLKCTYDSTEGMIQCQGYVQMATLSGLSLSRL